MNLITILLMISGLFFISCGQKSGSSQRGSNVIDSENTNNEQEQEEEEEENPNPDDEGPSLRDELKEKLSLLLNDHGVSQQDREAILSAIDDATAPGSGDSEITQLLNLYQTTLEAALDLDETHHETLFTGLHKGFLSFYLERNGEASFAASLSYHDQLFAKFALKLPEDHDDYIALVTALADESLSQLNDRYGEDETDIFLSVAQSIAQALNERAGNGDSIKIETLKALFQHFGDDVAIEKFPALAEALLKSAESLAAPQNLILEIFSVAMENASIKAGPSEQEKEDRIEALADLAEETLDSLIASEHIDADAKDMTLTLLEAVQINSTIVANGDTPEPPVLANAQAKTYVVSTKFDIIPFTFDNTGEDVTTCAVHPALPAGLSLVVDEDVATHSCRIEGRPTEAVAAAVYLVKATAADGSVGTANISITTVVDNVAPVVTDMSVALEGGEVVLRVTASDNIALHDLEVDHSLQDHLPEFTVYASETQPYGDDATQALFEGNGVSVTYSNGTWEIRIGGLMLAGINSYGGGSIDFYILVRDFNNNEWGSMEDVKPENTISYPPVP